MRSLSRVPLRIKVGLIAVLCLGFARFVFIPAERWQKESLERIRLLRGAVSRKKALVGQEDRIQALMEAHRNAHEETRRLFEPDARDGQKMQLAFQMELEQLAASLQVKVKSTDWLPVADGFIVRAPIKLRCQAAPGQLLKLIAAIERAERFRSVDYLQVMARPTHPLLNAELDVSVYGLRDGG